MGSGAFALAAVWTEIEANARARGRALIQAPAPPCRPIAGRRPCWPRLPLQRRRRGARRTFLCGHRPRPRWCSAWRGAWPHGGRSYWLRLGLPRMSRWGCRRQRSSRRHTGKLGGKLALCGLPHRRRRRLCAVARCTVTPLLCPAATWLSMARSAASRWRCRVLIQTTASSSEGHLSTWAWCTRECPLWVVRLRPSGHAS